MGVSTLQFVDQDLQVINRGGRRLRLIHDRGSGWRLEKQQGGFLDAHHIRLDLHNFIGDRLGALWKL